MTHAQLTAHEVGRLGVDHAALGAWLLRHWRLPESLCRIVEFSHSPAATDPQSRVGSCTRCVALGSECAEMLLGDRTSDKLDELSANAAAWLGIPPEGLGEAMERIVALVPEIERLFDTALLEADACAAILEQARELLMISKLQSKVRKLPAPARTAELEDRHGATP